MRSEPTSCSNRLNCCCIEVKDVSIELPRDLEFGCMQTEPLQEVESPGPAEGFPHYLLQLCDNGVM
jgi:hypothetical protein